MADFSVVLSDLDGLASRFSSQAQAFETAATKLNPAVADSGDGTCNTAIHGVMDMLSILNRSMVSSIEDHSDKIHDARSKYAYTEDENKNRFLWDNMNKDFE